MKQGKQEASWMESMSARIEDSVKIFGSKAVWRLGALALLFSAAPVFAMTPIPVLDGNENLAAWVNHLERVYFQQKRAIEPAVGECGDWMPYILKVLPQFLEARKGEGFVGKRAVRENTEQLEDIKFMVKDCTANPKRQSCKRVESLLGIEIKNLAGLSDEKLVGKMTEATVSMLADKTTEFMLWCDENAD